MTLTINLNQEFNYVLVQSQPKKILGQDVAQTIQQKPLSSYLKDYLQKQLDQQNAEIIIETLAFQFT